MNVQMISEIVGECFDNIPEIKVYGNESYLFTVYHRDTEFYTLGKTMFDHLNQRGVVDCYLLMSKDDVGNPYPFLVLAHSRTAEKSVRELVEKVKKETGYVLPSES